MCIKLNSSIHSESPMLIFDHNQPKIIQVILNFPFLARLITDFTCFQDDGIIVIAVWC